jgi:hypothetical protein
VDIGFVDLGISEDFLNGLERASEEVLAKFFEASTRE